MDLEIKCDSASATLGTRKMVVVIENADKSEILGHFTVKDIIDNFSIRELLDEIGSDEAEKHFDLIPNPES